MTHVYKIDIHQSFSLILKYRFQPLAENGGLIETNRWIYFTDIIREEMVPSAILVSRLQSVMPAFLFY